MIDKLLEIGCVFDWISPVLAGIQDIRYGANWTYLVPDNAGFSGRDVARILAGAGVESWGGDDRQSRHHADGAQVAGAVGRECVGARWRARAQPHRASCTAKR